MILPVSLKRWPEQVNDYQLAGALEDTGGRQSHSDPVIAPPAGALVLPSWVSRMVKTSQKASCLKWADNFK